MKTKKCAKCKKVKSFDDFSKHADCKNGIRGSCKTCENERAKKYELTRGYYITPTRNKQTHKYQCFHNEKTLGSFTHKKTCQQVIDRHHRREVMRAIEIKEEMKDHYYETL